MTHTTVHPRAKALFDELLFVADEYITVPTARALANELGLADFDPSDYDLG